MREVTPVALRTPAEFRASLQDGRAVYFEGERVADITQHPEIRVGIDTAALDYAITEDPANHSFAVATGLDGKPCSRFLTLPRSGEELLLRCQLVEKGSRMACGFPPFAKEGGADALNGLNIVVHHIDQQLGTEYAQRMAAFRRHLQQGDLSISVTMTDVKGNRTLRPAQQRDPDLYLRIVERRPDGIVVRGAKAHISSAPYTNELMVLPTRAMRAEEADYAVAFAVPPNTRGVHIVCRRPGGMNRSPEDFPVSTRFDVLEAMVIFDDVFVPWERVFMAGEWQFAGAVAVTFSNFHRVTAATYKYPFAELMVGAAHLIAEQNGLGSVTHVRDKIAFLVMYAETIRALAQAACLAPRRDEPSGAVHPDVTLGNAAKFFFADNYHQAVKAVQDIAGGLTITQPFARDWENPTLRPLLDKYLAGSGGTAERIAVFRLIRDMVASDMGGFWEITTLHAEGSLATERMAMYGSADFERYRAAALRAARGGKDA